MVKRAWIVGNENAKRITELPDIYGKGGEEGKLRSLIDELAAGLYSSPKRAC